MEKDLKKLDKEIASTVIGKSLSSKNFKKWYWVTKRMLALQKTLVENKKFDTNKKNLEEFINILYDSLRESDSWVNDQMTKEKVKDTFIGEKLTPEELDNWIVNGKILDNMKKSLMHKEYKETDFKIFSTLISARIVMEQEIQVLKQLRTTKLGKLFSFKELKDLRDIVGKYSLKDFAEEVAQFDIPMEEIEEFFTILIKF